MWVLDIAVTFRTRDLSMWGVSLHRGETVYKAVFLAAQSTPVGDKGPVGSMGKRQRLLSIYQRFPRAGQKVRAEASVHLEYSTCVPDGDR